MEQPILKIFYGPPGTGKTWKAAREAVRIIAGNDVPEDQFAALHKRLVAAGSVIWVTFHPSYSYEDFVEGYRPTKTEVGIMYEPKPGPFLDACNRAHEQRQVGSPSQFFVGQEIEATPGNRYRVEHAEGGEIVVRKIQGKGTDLLSPVSLWVVRKLIQSGFKPGDLSIPGEKHEEKQEISARTGIDMQSLFAMTGPLKAVWEHVVHEAPSERKIGASVVLVIDEINRADLSRVFGELITLLEPDKRLGASEEKAVLLPYSGQLLTVPPSVHLIGTMNTVDRSLSAMDNALRRRFVFEEVLPDPAICAHNYGGIDLGAVLRGWNRRIEALLSREHRIGHSYLMHSSLEAERQQLGLEDSHEGQLKTVASVIRNRIAPLLLEYFYDDWRKADIVLGRQKSSPGLLMEVDFRDVAEAADEIADLQDVTGYAIADFWNPQSRDWDARRFLGILKESSV